MIKKQEDVGMKLATDGEFRRTFWHFDFLGGMQGVDLYDHDAGHSVPGCADQEPGTSASTARSISRTIIPFSNISGF